MVLFGKKGVFLLYKIKKERKAIEEVKNIFEFFL